MSARVGVIVVLDGDWNKNHTPPLICTVPRSISVEDFYELVEARLRQHLLVPADSPLPSFVLRRGEQRPMGGRFGYSGSYGSYSRFNTSGYDSGGASTEDAPLEQWVESPEDSGEWRKNAEPLFEGGAGGEETGAGGGGSAPAAAGGLLERAPGGGGVGGGQKLAKQYFRIEPKLPRAPENDADSARFEAEKQVLER